MNICNVDTQINKYFLKYLMPDKYYITVHSIPYIAAHRKYIFLCITLTVGWHQKCFYDKIWQYYTAVTIRSVCVCGGGGLGGGGGTSIISSLCNHLVHIYCNVNKIIYWLPMRNINNSKEPSRGASVKDTTLSYSIEENPPWYLGILLGFQVWNKILKRI